MSTQPAGTQIPAQVGGIKPVTDGYRRYALGVLFVVYVFNFIDRQIVTILAEPIKQDLQIADWQLGLMTGTAFAIFYCTLGNSDCSPGRTTQPPLDHWPVARRLERLHRVVRTGPEQ